MDAEGEGRRSDSQGGRVQRGVRAASLESAGRAVKVGKAEGGLSSE